MINKTDKGNIPIISAIIRESVNKRGITIKASKADILLVTITNIKHVIIKKPNKATTKSPKNRIRLQKSKYFFK
jgi:hypothetical protein